MPTFSELKDSADNKSLVHRHLQGVAFMAPMTTELPASILSSATELTAVAAGFWPVGIVGPSGFVFSSEIEKDEVEGWGYADPVRTDITKVPKQVVFTPLERYKRRIQELVLSMDLSTVTAAAVTNEVVFDEPDLPEPVERRLLVVSFDGRSQAPVIRAKGLAAVKLAEFGDDAWNAESDSVGQEITLDVLSGPEGFAVRHYAGGGGFDVDAHGFQVAGG